MAVIVFLTLAVLGIVQNPLQLGDELDVATHSFMQQRAEQLSWKMTQLLQDIEQTQEQNGVAKEVLFLASLQQWWFWASALGTGALVLLLWLCWSTRKRSCKPKSSFKQDSPGSQGEEEEEEVEEDHDSVTHVIWANFWPIASSDQCHTWLTCAS